MKKIKIALLSLLVLAIFIFVFISLKGEKIHKESAYSFAPVTVIGSSSTQGTSQTESASIEQISVAPRIVASSAPIIKEDRVANEKTIKHEGPGGMSIRIPESLNRYSTSESKKYFSSTEYQIHFPSEKYFSENNFSPSLAEIFIDMIEEEGNENCGRETLYGPVNERQYFSGGHLLTEIDKQSEYVTRRIIIVSSGVDSNKCLYLSIIVQSQNPELLRAIFREEYEQYKDFDIEKIIHDTKSSEEYLKALIPLLSKTFSVE